MEYETQEIINELSKTQDKELYCKLIIIVNYIYTD